MYHYIDDKEFLGKLRKVTSDCVNRLVNLINNEDYLKVKAHLVGSGAHNMVTQNANEPIDLDFNLVIIGINGDINDCKTIKNYIMNKYNEVLNELDWGNCNDSTSALTTKNRYFTDGNQTLWSIDLGIIVQNQDGRWWRLKHHKSGYYQNNEWFWNEGPSTNGLTSKVNNLKSNNLWEEVRECYLEKKNMYLTRNDYNHPSYVCYIEAVNEVYGRYKWTKSSK